VEYLLVAASGAVLAAVVVWLQRSVKADVLAAAAGRLGGRLVRESRGAFRIDLRPEGVRAEIRFAGPWTRIRFAWRAPGTLRAAPEGALSVLQRLVGVQDIEVGEAEFDALYVVQGAPEEWVRRALDREVRLRIRQVAALGASMAWPTSVTLDAGPGGLSVTTARLLDRRPDELLTFVALATGIFRRLRDESAGILQVVSIEERATDGQCPVCSTALGASVVHCRRCRTPHHGECWAYFQGCAIFGCGGRRVERS
jgi:hypothetical protein